QSDQAQAHRGALRLGQNGRARPADRLPGNQEGRSALQADDDRLESRPNGANTECGTARSCGMKRRTASNARLLGVQLARIDSSGCQRASGTLAKPIVALASRRNSTAC